MTKQHQVGIKRRPSLSQSSSTHRANQYEKSRKLPFRTHVVSQFVYCGPVSRGLRPDGTCSDYLGEPDSDECRDHAFRGRYLGLPVVGQTVDWSSCGRYPSCATRSRTPRRGPLRSPGRHRSSAVLGATSWRIAEICAYFLRSVPLGQAGSLSGCCPANVNDVQDPTEDVRREMIQTGQPRQGSGRQQ